MGGRTGCLECLLAGEGEAEGRKSRSVGGDWILLVRDGGVVGRSALW